MKCKNTADIAPLSKSVRKDMPLHATKMVKYLLFRSDFFCLIALWTLCCYGPKYS